MINLIEIFKIFRKGYTPQEEEFKQTWSSFWHKSEKIPAYQIETINGDFGALSPISDNDFFGVSRKRTSTVGQAIKVGSTWTNILSSTTSESVNYQVVNKYADGTAMDDSKVNGVIYRKRGDEYLKLVCSYANVEWFGAKGDNTTDNTASLQAAIDFAIKTNTPLYYPKGIYCVSGTIKASIPPNNILRMFGDGATTILKNADGSVTADWKNIIVIAPLNAISNGGSLELENIKFDANARSNPLPEGTSDYAWEHCGTIRIGASAGYKMKSIRIINTQWTDAIADHIYFNGYCKDVFISDFYAYSRTRSRSDIEFSVPSDNVVISNAILDKLEAEFIPTAIGIMKLFLTNVVCNMVLDLGGMMKVEANNLYSANTYLSHVSGNILSSTLKFSHGARINNSKGLTIKNTDLYLVADEENNIVQRLWIYQNEENHALTFDSVKFIVDSDKSNIFKGHAVEAVPRGITENKLTDILTLINCEFDPRFSSSVIANRSQNIRLINNIYAGSGETGFAISLYSANDYPQTVVIDGGDFSRVTTKHLRFTASGLMDFSLKNVCIDVADTLLSENSQALNFTPRINNRKIYLAEVPTGGGLVGDVAMLRVPKVGEPYKWIATKNSSIDAGWVVIGTL